MSVITEEQRTQLEASQRYRSIATEWVKSIATYLRGQDGTSGNTAGKSPVDWAKCRMVAAGIILHPNSQNYGEWISQMTMLLKGQDVWQSVADADPATALQKSIDATIDFMVDSNPDPEITVCKFEELTNLVFTIQASPKEF